MIVVDLVIDCQILVATLQDSLRSAIAKRRDGPYKLETIRERKA